MREALLIPSENPRARGRVSSSPTSVGPPTGLAECHGSNNCEGRGWGDSTGNPSMLKLTLHALEWGTKVLPDLSKVTSHRRSPGEVLGLNPGPQQAGPTVPGPCSQKPSPTPRGAGGAGAGAWGRLVHKPGTHSKLKDPTLTGRHGSRVGRNRWDKKGARRASDTYALAQVPVQSSLCP